MEPMDDAAQLGEWIRDAQRIVVLTGAGISTDSGIPDYRGPQGVWTKNPKAEQMSNIRYYISDPEVRQLAWQSRIHSPAWSAQPNSGHRAVCAIHNAGKLHALITQNIDELHQQSGVPAHKVVEVHGTMRYSICWSCGDRRDMQVTLERVRAGDPDPACELCGGILKSDTISFGQPLVPEVIDRAFTVAEQGDLFVAIGTTLSVGPVNQVVPRARTAGSRVAIVNGEPTSMDHYADAVVLGDISTVLRDALATAGIPT